MQNSTYKKKFNFKLSRNPVFYISIENLKETGASYEQRPDSKNNQWQNILQKHQKNGTRAENFDICLA